MLRLSIRTKLIVALICLLMGAFTFTTSYFYSTSRQSIEEIIINETLPLITNNIYRETKNELNEVSCLTSLMTKESAALDWFRDKRDATKLLAYLNEVRKDFRVVTAFAVKASTREYYSYKGILKILNDQDYRDDWYYKFIASGKEVEMNLNPDVVNNNRLVVFVNHRVEDEKGKLLGVIGVGMDLDRVGHALYSYRHMYNREIFLTDARGVVQMHSNLGLVLEKNLADLYGGMKGLAAEILSTKAGLVIFNRPYENRTVYLAVRYLPVFDWFLVVAQDRESLALEDLRGAMISSLTVAFLATVLAIALMVFAVNYFQGKLEALATTDELTGCANRRAYMDALREELIRARRYQKDLTIMSLDIDHFKKINDTYGHGVGDIALQTVVRTVQSCLRASDRLGRVGGEEFGIILPETNADNAAMVAERIRAAVENAVVTAGSYEVKLTISIGYCQAPIGANDINKLLNLTDEALYESKGTGRNRVCSYSGDL